MKTDTEISPVPSLLISVVTAACIVAISILFYATSLSDVPNDDAYTRWVANHPTYVIRQVDEVIAGVRTADTIQNKAVRDATILVSQGNVASLDDAAHLLDDLRSGMQKTELTPFLDTSGAYKYTRNRKNVEVYSECGHDICIAKTPFNVLNDAQLYYNLRNHGIAYLPNNLEVLPEHLRSAELGIMIPSPAPIEQTHKPIPYVTFGAIYTFFGGLIFHFSRSKKAKRKMPGNVLTWVLFATILPGWLLIQVCVGNISAGYTVLREKLRRPKKSVMSIYDQTLADLQKLRDKSTDPKLKKRCELLTEKFSRIRVEVENEPIAYEVEKLEEFEAQHRKE